jgi:hypothetical protein
MKRVIIALAVVAGMFVEAGASRVLAQRTQGCSDASLRGGYGIFADEILLPAGTRRSTLARIAFDGAGKYSVALTFDDEGKVTHATDAGTYIVNPDCTGKLITNGGKGTVEIVLVDGGKEFYQLRTSPSTTALYRFNVATKQLPDE